LAGDMAVGYRTACGSLHLKPYSSTSCNMTVMHKNAGAW